MIVATPAERRPSFGLPPVGSGAAALGRAAPSGVGLAEPTTLVRADFHSGASAGWGTGSAGPSSRGVGRPPPLAPGDRLGDYRLLERLGRGGQGDVWKAVRHQPTIEVVALKVLKPALARDPSRMAQFRREAERGGRLAGPCLLPVYELGACGGFHFMAMPLVDGVTLREVIRDRVAHVAGRPVDDRHRLVTLDDPDYLAATARVLADASEALGRAHAQRVAHRDIKPANILLDGRRPEGVYLCDFGLGRDLEVATLQQMRDGAGTPMYMAPERLLRAVADEVRCDIYSMGVTIFEALTLSRPFHVPDWVTFSALPAFLAAAQPRRPAEVCPGFPDALEAVILRAMERDPSGRYDSAEGLAADLRLAAARLAPRDGRAPFDAPHAPLARGPHLNRPAQRG